MSSRETDFHEIDLNNLEVEWAEHVASYRHFAEKATKTRKVWRYAQTDLEVAEEELKDTSARLDLAVRRDPKQFGLEKTTETAIENVVRLHKDYQAARQEVFRLNREVHDAEYDMGMANAAVKTLDHKRDGLEDEVQLRLSNYFSEPRLKGQAREAMDDNRKRNVRNRGREDA